MFAFVPISYCNIFGGTIAIGWQAYLSLLNQRAAGKELEDWDGVDLVVEVNIQSAPVASRARVEEKGENGKCVA